MVFWINIAIIILEICGLSFSVPARKGAVFAFYTQVSNILTLVSSAALALCVGGALTFDGSGAVTATLRYTSSCMLAMTFLITLFVLVPMGGGFRKLMLMDVGLFHHTLCPILSIASYIILERHASVWILPTVITFAYGIIMLIMNGLGKFDGPYPFFRVRYQSRTATVLWVIALTGIISTISIVLAKIAA